MLGVNRSGVASVEVLTQLGRFEKIAALRFDGLFTGLVDDRSKGRTGDIVRTRWIHAFLCAELPS